MYAIETRGTVHVYFVFPQNNFYQYIRSDLIHMFIPDVIESYHHYICRVFAKQFCLCIFKALQKSSTPLLRGYYSYQ